MRPRALDRVACWKMAEDGGRWLTWLLWTATQRRTRLMVSKQSSMAEWTR